MPSWRSMNSRRPTASIRPASACSASALAEPFATLLASDDSSHVKSLVTWSSVGDLQNDFLNELGQKGFDRAKEDGIVGLDLGWRTIRAQNKPSSTALRSTRSTMQSPPIPAPI